MHGHWKHTSSNSILHPNLLVLVPLERREIVAYSISSSAARPANKPANKEHNMQATAAAPGAGAMAMPSPEGFPILDATYSDEHHDGLPLELEPTYTPEDEQRELATLSIPDIVKLQSDLQGITAGISGLRVDDRTDTRSTCMDQTTTRSTASLSRLDEEISRLPDEQTAAYYRATAECPNQVSDERKIAFLEYEDGDAVLAATRLAKYWEFRLDLFGPERCFLPMTLAGAMKDEVAPMDNRRIYQLMPVTDAAGRAVLYSRPSRRNFDEYGVEQEFRSLFYLLESVVEDTNLRRRGIAMLVNGGNTQRKHYSRKGERLAAMTESVLPIRYRAIHICFPSKLLYYVIYPVVKHFLPKDVRLRMKLHYGSTDQVLRDLEHYCLPRDRLPTELGGDVVLDMNKWVKERKTLEISRPGLCMHSSSADDPAAKRMRGESGQGIAAVPVPGAPAPSAPGPISKNGQKSGKVPGKRSDPRMTRAIEEKLGFPALSLRDALVSGGFVFREDNSRIVDADGVTLAQRKNNLCRRLRIEKQKRAEKGAVGSTLSASSNAESEQDGMASPMSVSPSIEAIGTSSQLQAQISGKTGVDIAKHSALYLEGNGVTTPATNSSTDGNSNVMNVDQDGARKRDSFYESILKLPGLDDVDGLDFSDHDDA